GQFLGWRKGRRGDGARPQRFQCRGGDIRNRRHVFMGSGWRRSGRLQLAVRPLRVEGDFDWSNLKGSISAQCAFCGPATATLEHDVNWFGTARGRIGYAADGWLAYVTGGYAFGRVELKGTATAGGATAGFTPNSTPSRPTPRP